MKLRKLFISLLAGAALVSCENNLDINKNPNASSEIGPEYLFNGAATVFSGNRHGGDGSIPVGFGSQLWATGWTKGWGAGAEDTYNFSIYSLNNNWSTTYVNTGKNLVQAINIAKESVPVQSNAIAQCKILNALNYYQTTVMFGDIPFSQAINFDYDEPVFDSQKDVLNGVVALLDEAIADVDQTSSLKIDDFYYEGDMTKWIKLAKSLKFRTLMVMVDADDSKVSEIKSMLSAGGMISTANEEMIFPYFDKTGNKHPMRAIREKYYGPDGIDDMFPGKALVDIMNAANDPRRPVFLRFGYVDDKKTLETRYIGCASCTDRVKEAPGATSFFNGEVIWAAEQGDELFTLSEQLLLEAEAQVRFNDDLAKGKQLFDDALRAACARWNVTEGVDEFVEGFPEFATKDQALKLIYEQNWVDQFTRPFEAFTSWRRSGTIGKEIPHLVKPEKAIAGGANGEDMFRRFTTPPDALQSNKNAPENVQHYDRVWFDL